MPQHAAGSRSVLPDPENKSRAVADMFDRIAPRYDLLNRILTFGLDGGWRRRAVGLLSLPAGSVVADLACGTGDFCRELERAGHRAVGIDFSAGMLRSARTAAPLVRADILRTPLRDGSADGIVCGFALRNVTDVGGLFVESARVLRRGGRAVFLEVDEPRSALLRAGHRLYFHRIVPLVGGLLSDRQAYRYLPESTAYLPPTDALTAMLSESGFDAVGARRVGLGAAQLVWGTRR